MDETKLGREQNRGLQAEVLLGEDSIFNYACAELEKVCLNQWRDSKAFETAERENAWRTLKAMDAVRQILKQYVITGRVAARDLKRFSEELERKQSGRRSSTGTRT